MVYNRWTDYGIITVLLFVVKYGFYEKTLNGRFGILFLFP